MNKLGLDYDSPTIARGPGRPKTRTDESQIEAGQAELQKEALEEKTQRILQMAEESKRRLEEKKRREAEPSQAG